MRNSLDININIFKKFNIGHWSLHICAMQWVDYTALQTLFESLFMNDICTNSFPFLNKMLRAYVKEPSKIKYNMKMRNHNIKIERHSSYDKKKWDHEAPAWNVLEGSWFKISCRTEQRRRNISFQQPTDTTWTLTHPARGLTTTQRPYDRAEASCEAPQPRGRLRETVATMRGCIFSI